jgi:hypothetical protein
MGKYSGTIIELSETQMQIARGHGRIRTLANRKIKRRDNRTPGFDGLTIDALGVAGEMATAIVTGIEYTGLFLSRKEIMERRGQPIPDLGSDIEVRTTTKPTYRLIVHKNDPTHWRFVLVRKVEYAVFDVVGWQHGHEIKRDDLWNSTLHYPGFTYPTAWLRPIEELIGDPE